MLVLVLVGVGCVLALCLLCFVRVLFCVFHVLCGLVLRLRRGLCCWLLVVCRMLTPP